MSTFYEKYFNRKITFVLPVGKAILYASAILVCIYWLFAMYWYQRSGLNFVKWHSHLVFLFTFWLIGAFILLRSNFLKYFSAFFIMLFLVELFFVFSGSKKTLYENMYSFYISPYDPQIHTHHHIWDPYKTSHQLTSSEYSFFRPTNSEGFADVEWKSDVHIAPLKKIIALGDSFTEGDGANYDSSYVAGLNHILMPDSIYFVMNGGICGSDPFENYMNLKDRLMVYQPEIVIQTISANDIYTDISIKGGFERFIANDSLQYKPAPYWEPLYALSYTSRFFFEWLGYDSFLVNKDSPHLEKELNYQLKDLFEKYITLCSSKGVKFVLVILPLKSEIDTGKYDFDFTTLVTYLQNKPVTICDLLPYYRTKMINKSGQVDHKAFFWQYDPHHNAKGYNIMANGIYSCLQPLLDTKQSIGNN